jgi:hypothetical protein
MGLYIVNSAGAVIGWVDTNAEANALLEQVPDDIYTFFVGGLPDEVEDYILQLNTASDGVPSFFDILKEKYGRVPESINPFVEIRDAYFKHNTFFIKLNYSLLNSRTTSQMFNVLHRTLPAGASFFVLVERRLIEEGLVDAVSELPDVFYALDVAEVDDDNFGERVLAESVI